MKKKEKKLSYDEIIKLEMVPIKYVSSIALSKGIALSIGSLNRWCQQGRVEFTMIGGRAYFSQEQIQKILRGEIRNESK